MSKNFEAAMLRRHACKRFDEGKKLSDEEIRSIVDVGRNSPSSFGIEPWKFLVISNNELRAKLRPYCWDQEQITSSSHLVVFLASISGVRPDSGIPHARLGRRGLPQEQLDAYVKRYATFLADAFSSDEKTFCWSARQTYIAAANMMTYAATKGIDSCPMEGFEKERVEEILELDPKEYQVALLVAFGHRVREPRPKTRLPLEEVAVFLY